MPVHMSMRRFILCVALLAAAATTHAQSAIDQDPPPDRTNPASMAAFRLPSHGVLLNALVYVAPGPGPHPVVLLLHGFPGNEKNLDIAQTLRRAGYDVLYFDYRGSWGSPGDFSFTHGLEDVDAVIDYLRTPANATRLRADPNRLILGGHSMGGMFAAITAAHHAKDPWLKAVVLISAANMAGRILPAVQSGHSAEAVAPLAKALAAEGMAPLAGCTPESLAKELITNAAAWNIPDLAPGLAAHPILVISSDDGLAPYTDALIANLTKLGDTQVKSVHLPTDHSYSDHRIALQQAILDTLAHTDTK